MPPGRSWSPGCFLCTTSSTLRELPVAGVNLLSAQDARIEIGGGGAQIRGSGSSGLAAQPQSRRCSECCDSIHPPAGHIYQCVPSFERAEHEIAVCWQLGEQRTGGAAIQRTGGAANRGSQHKRSNEPRGVPFTFCMFAAREIVSLLISTCLSARFPFSYFCAEQIWRRGSVLFCTSSRKTSRLGTGLQIKSLNCTVDLTTVAGRGPRKDGWPSAGLRRSTRTQAVPVGRLLPPCLPSNLAIFLQEEEQLVPRDRASR